MRTKALTLGVANPKRRSASDGLRCCASPTWGLGGRSTACIRLEMNLLGSASSCLDVST